MTAPDDFDAEDWRERRTQVEAESAELGSQADAYIAKRRGEGASYRKIGDELGLSHTAVRDRAGEFNADAWIRGKAGRGPAQDDGEIDGNEWLRNKTFNTGAYGRKRAIRDALAGITDEQGDAQ